MKNQFFSQFDPPEDLQAGVLGIEAEYKKNVQWFSTVPSAVSKGGSYIDARLRTENPTVGRNVIIGISTTEVPTTFTYVVFGRGRLVFAETLKGSGTTYNEISFRASATVSPRCRVLVYFVSDRNAEVVADSLDFEVKGTLANFVDVFASRKRQLPGKDVTVNVKSKPNSFVGILAVDKRVHRLNKLHSQENNDITMGTVVDELRTYDSAQDPDFYPWFSVIKPKESALSWHTGSSASQQVFEKSGTIVLTNAVLQNSGRGRAKANVQIEYHGDSRPFGRPIPKPDQETLNPDKGPGVVVETQTRPPLAGPYAFSRLPKPVDNLPKVILNQGLYNFFFNLIFDRFT